MPWSCAWARPCSWGWNVTWMELVTVWDGSEVLGVRLVREEEMQNACPLESWYWLTGYDVLHLFCQESGDSLCLSVPKIWLRPWWSEPRRCSWWMVESSKLRNFKVAPATNMWPPRIEIAWCCCVWLYPRSGFYRPAPRSVLGEPAFLTLQRLEPQLLVARNRTAWDHKRTNASSRNMCDKENLSCWIGTRVHILWDAVCSNEKNFPCLSQGLSPCCALMLSATCSLETCWGKRVLCSTSAHWSTSGSGSVIVWLPWWNASNFPNSTVSKSMVVPTSYLCEL